MHFFKSKFNRESFVLVVVTQNNHLNLLTQKAFLIIADVFIIDMMESGWY